MYIGLSRAHFLSPTGQCRPFDESADGYCRAEGCGLFVIKRLQDATHDNDRIYGVIRDIEVNQSGNASSITHPHGEAQVQLFQKLLSRSKIDPRSIGVIEAHGTGTQAGDAVEMASIESCFADPAHLVYLTSIKANLGHAEAASGSVGLGKLLLMLQHSKIPAQIGRETLNPKLQSLASKNIKIPTRALDWPSPANQSRRALLNNFGAAGSNAALILEEFRDRGQGRHQRAAPRKAYNWIISAKSAEALRTLVARYHELLSSSGKDVSIRDLCFTATARRQLYDHQLSLVVESTADLASQLESPSCLDATRSRSHVSNPIVFVFSGQGSFYLGMGRELLHTAPTFRRKVFQCDEILQQLGYNEVRPSQVLDGTAALDNPASVMVLSQVACFVVEIALADLFQSWAIQPDLVIGHR